ncbi:hypothetical protein W97_03798 [Coniosporium apollinis CBS 100218]|uniref:Uncharacterized protein n=1 Tax=Coniosporium apollinis (strain CBS 100218) TaxID=1168221 RepID=R7YRN5_CONA1|nr:uncharacterized protein W97_03798 [Coniosporium apollinis CBS 100218]EON64565.1 hypothetical protein W97_03798 [Coniosporium apollinis CBS 100218]
MESVYEATGKDREISNWVKMASVDGLSKSIREDSFDPIPFEVTKHAPLPTIGEDETESIPEAGPRSIGFAERTAIRTTSPFDHAADIVSPFEPRAPPSILPSSSANFSFRAFTRALPPTLHLTTHEPAPTVGTVNVNTPVLTTPDAISPTTSFRATPVNLNPYSYNGDITGVNRRPNPKTARVARYNESLSPSISGTSTPLRPQRVVQFDDQAAAFGEARPRPARHFSHTSVEGKLGNASTTNLPGSAHLTRVGTPMPDAEAQESKKAKTGIRGWVRDLPSFLKWLVGVGLMVGILALIVLLFMFKSSLGWTSRKDRYE